MKFGLLYEITVPDLTRESEHRSYAETIEQVTLAEEVGFDSVWAVEHHFMTQFSHSTAPEVWLSYLAAKTNRIRLGHGVRLLPFPYNHPIKLAEQAAALDILSNGRLEFGTGRSGTLLELDGFRINPADTRGMWREALDMIPAMWQDGTFSHEGQYFSVPERNVIPKPMQSPHPPMWAACTSADSHEMTGSLGLGLLSFTIALNTEEMARRIRLYRAAIKQATPVGKFVNERAAVFSLAHCAPTTSQAIREAQEGIMFYNRHQIDYLATMATGSATLDGYEYYKAFVGIDHDKFTFDYLHQRNMVVVGDPAHCRDTIACYQEAGVDTLLLHVQNWGIPHEQVMRSIRLFGEEVAPHFADVGDKVGIS